MKARSGVRSRNFYTFLVLFLTLSIAGAAGYCYFQAARFQQQAREELLYLAECRQEASIQNVLELQKAWESDPDIRKVEYISPERSAALLEEELPLASGEQEMAEVLPAMLAIYFRDDVFASGQLESKLETLRSRPEIQGIYAQPELLVQLGQNLKAIGTGLGVAGALVCILCYFLLASIIKLSLYADRTEIKTMQLVGAKPAYIRKPYLRRYLGLALLAGLSTSVLVSASHWAISGFGIPTLEATTFLLALDLSVILLGLLLTGWVTVRMVNKYIFADIASLF